jgi:hypothetical protein
MQAPRDATGQKSTRRVEHGSGEGSVQGCSEQAKRKEEGEEPTRRLAYATVDSFWNVLLYVQSVLGEERARWFLHLRILSMRWS